MEGKKRYIAIILFLLICLMVFTFATTGDEELENGTGNGNNVQEITDNGKTDKDDKTESDSKEENKGNTNTSNSNKNESKDDEDLDGTGNVDNEAWDKALAAVEELEELLTDEQAEIARDLVEQITNSDQYKELMDRVEDAEDAIDATELVEQLEKMVEEAAKKADITDAGEFRDEEVIDAINEIDGETLADVKADLEKRVEELSKILDDETAPTVEGIEDGKHTKEEVSLTITDENEVTTKVTQDGNEIDFAEKFTEEGTYEVTVVDAAFNEKTLSFTIDKTAPKFEGLPSREAHIDNYEVDVTDKNETTITLQKDHGKFNEIEEGYKITEEGTYQLVAEDKAGNKYTTWIIIDKTLPTITGVTNGSIVNQCENVYVFDRYLKTVDINGTVYTRKDFTHDVKNENFKFSPKKICAEGTYTITATDMSGKTYTETFTIDRTKAIRLSADFYTNGVNAIEEIIDGEKYNVYYTNEGKVVAANIAMNEELKAMPKFTFYINGKAYKATSTRTSYDEANKKWYYHATLNITDEMDDGELTFIASEIYDKAGNKTDDVAGPTNSRRVFVDQTAAKIMSSDFYVHGLTEKDKVFYTKKGNKITVNITTNEILGSNPTFTLHNNGKDYNVDKVVYRGLNDKGYYLYQADFELTEDSEMTDGEVTFTVNNILDRAGNPTNPVTAPTNRRRVVIDATPNRVTQTSLSTKVSEGKTYYVINGETIDFSIGFRELLGENAKVTIGGKEVTLTYDKYYEAINTHLYRGTLTIAEDESEMIEGELEIVITNITDKAGNKGFYYQTNGKKVIESYKNTITTNGRKVIYDRTNNRVTQTSLSTKVSEGKTYYVINGETIDFSIGFRELLGENAKVTIGGKEVTLTYDKYYEAINTHLYRGTLTIPANETEMVEGELEIVITNITDKAGNKGFYYQTNGKKVIESYKNTVTTNGRKVIYDRTNNRVTQTSLSTKVSEGKTYYVINGETIDFSIGFRELLGENAKVTIGGKEVTLTYDKYYEAINTHLYRGTLTIPANETEMVEGELEIVITNITDKAGNKGFYYQTNGKKVIESYKNTVTTNGRKVIYDRTPNRITQTFYRGDRKEGTTFYVKNGEKVQFNIGFREMLGEDAVITIGGQKVELKYDKYYEATKSHMYYGYLEIAEDESEMIEGELEIVITNITDKAGNKGFYYQTNGKKVLESYSNVATTNGGIVVYDRTPNRITQTFFRGDVKENNTFYVTNGSKIQFNIGFSEKLGKDAVITIGGKKVELTYERYYEATKSHMYYGYIEFTAEDNFEDGYLEINISNITDPLENTGFYYQTNGKTVLESYNNTVTTNGQKVFYDTTAPEVTPSYTEKTFEEDSEDKFTGYPTFDVKDNSNATVETELIYDNVNINKVGIYKLVYKFTDKVGNTTKKTIIVKVVDTKAPTIEGIEDGAYYNTKDTHAIPVAKDKNGAVMFIKTELGDVTLTSFLKNEKEIKLVGTYQVYAVDIFGNKSEEITVHIDPYNPKVLVLDRLENISGAYLPIKPVILEHNLDTIKVTLDGKEIDYKYGDQLTKDGKYVMTVTDKAGNSTTVEFTMDSVAPTMMISPLTLGVVDQLDLNDIAALDNLTGNLILSEDAEFQLMKANKNLSILDYNIPIYEFVELPEDGLIDEEGDYILIAYDKAYNLTAAKFVVDKTAPVINAEDGKFYSSLTLDVKDANLSTITVKKKGALLATPVENGYVIDEEGTYEIVAKDVVGANLLAENYKDHITTITIHIDRTAPTANVVEGGIYTSTTVVVEDENLDTESITINGTKYDEKEITEEGNYTLVAKDLAGNKLEVNFEIDKTPIIISGVENNGLYNADVELEVTARDEEAVIKLDGSTIGSKYTITADGKYKVKVTDKWGNEAEVEFTLDKTAPTIINPFAELTNEVGAKKDAVQSVVANVTDNLDANKTVNPTVKHSVKGNMGELSEIPVTKDYIGTYTLTYTTTDTAGNIAETLVVTVEVIVNDYVLSFVDVDNNNFTYTYGDEINIKAELYSSVLEETIEFDAEDVTIEVVEGTMKNVGTYTVTATVDTAKYPNAKVEPQVFTIVKKDVTVSFDKNHDKLSSITEYEFNGLTDPFKIIGIDGVVEGDEVGATITYGDCDFGVGTCVAKVKLDSDNYNVTNPTHEFKIVQATADVDLPLLATGSVKVYNKDRFDITEFVNINKYTKSTTGSIKVTSWGNELLNKKYNVEYTIIDVTAKNANNIKIEKTDLEVIGLEEISNILTAVKNNPLVGFLAKIEEDLTDNTNEALDKETTYGASRGYVNITEVK